MAVVYLLLDFNVLGTDKTKSFCIDESVDKSCAWSINRIWFTGWGVKQGRKRSMLILHMGIDNGFR